MPGRQSVVFVPLVLAAPARGQARRLNPPAGPRGPEVGDLGVPPDYLPRTLAVRGERGQGGGTIPVESTPTRNASLSPGSYMRSAPPLAALSQACRSRSPSAFRRLSSPVRCRVGGVESLGRLTRCPTSPWSLRRSPATLARAAAEGPRRGGHDARVAGENASRIQWGRLRTGNWFVDSCSRSTARCACRAESRAWRPTCGACGAPIQTWC